MSSSTPHTRPSHVDPAAVAHWIDTDPDSVTVIDVRSAAEFHTAHIAGSYNVPLGLLGEHAAQFAARLDRHVVLVCQSGARATQAERHLAGVGAQNLSVLGGGVPGYFAAGGSVIRSQARWAMERQVHLVAGTLVAASITASIRVPAARFVSGARRSRPDLGRGQQHLRDGPRPVAGALQPGSAPSHRRTGPG